MNPAPVVRACALTIAGLDPSGGAGIAADLRGFYAAGVWGCAVCPMLTAQSTSGLESTWAVPAGLLKQQVSLVLRTQRVRAIKTGALGSSANVRAVVELLSLVANVPLVVDPVIAPTQSKEGRSLLEPEAMASLGELISISSLVTPNVDELERLLGWRVEKAGQMLLAGEQLLSRGSQAVLVKGGHVAGSDADDLLVTRTGSHWLRGRRILSERRVHGAGCTYSSLIAGKLAADGSSSDAGILGACQWAKTVMNCAFERACDIGNGMLVLEPKGPDGGATGS